MLKTLHQNTGHVCGKLVRFIHSKMLLKDNFKRLLKTVSDQISKHLEVRQRYFATHRIFNSLLDVWKCGQTRFFVFVTLLPVFLKLSTRKKNKRPL